ncbi:TPA: hypothetical protein P0E30_003778 [Vibrio harveyi]|nr:hypothetical protein [Vibrio harveyi]
MIRSTNRYILPILIIITGSLVLLSIDFEHKPALMDCPTVQVRADPRTYSFVELAVSPSYGNNFLNLLHKETEKGLRKAEANQEAREKVAIAAGFNDSFTALNFNLANAELQRKAGVYRLCQFHWDKYHREGDKITSLDFVYLRDAVEEFEVKMHKIVKKCVETNLEKSEPTFINAIKRMCRTKALEKMGVIKVVEE